MAFSLTWRETVGALASCGHLLPAEMLLQTPLCTPVRHSSQPAALGHGKGGGSMRSAASLALNDGKMIPFLLFSLQGVSVPALQSCSSWLALARGGQAELCWCGAALCTFFSMMPGTPFPQGLKILLLQQSASGAKS